VTITVVVLGLGPGSRAWFMAAPSGSGAAVLGRARPDCRPVSCCSAASGVRGQAVPPFPRRSDVAAGETVTGEGLVVDLVQLTAGVGEVAASWAGSGRRARPISSAGLYLTGIAAVPV
jgi:hypothetical protein